MINKYILDYIFKYYVTGIVAEGSQEPDENRQLYHIIPNAHSDRISIAASGLLSQHAVKWMFQ